MVVRVFGIEYHNFLDEETLIQNRSVLPRHRLLLCCGGPGGGLGFGPLDFKGSRRRKFLSSARRRSDSPASHQTAALLRCDDMEFRRRSASGLSSGIPREEQMTMKKTLRFYQTALYWKKKLFNGGDLYDTRDP